MIGFRKGKNLVNGVKCSKLAFKINEVKGLIKYSLLEHLHVVKFLFFFYQSDDYVLNTQTLTISWKKSFLFFRKLDSCLTLQKQTLICCLIQNLKSQHKSIVKTNLNPPTTAHNMLQAEQYLLIYKCGSIETKTTFK